ncbi:MAG TPA: pantoate--beta-alanine ligase [Actinomycetota bacterium]
MRLLETIGEARALLDKERASGRGIGFVPTMGYLHEGHASLIRRARADDDVVVASIFVNPLQFGPAEDLAAYPRDLDRDLDLCEREGVDAVFHPAAQEMYPEPNPFTITVGEIGTKLCGATRPGHFDGVATVVAKLWNIVGPCRSYFGEKDYQQLVILRRLARAFDVPIEVIGCPIVREPDGIALSSRNIYLDGEERRAALVLKVALDEAARRAEEGERDGVRLAEGMAARISSEPLAGLDYAACVDPETLGDLQLLGEGALLAVAAWVGKARLIDNVTVETVTR